jgi:glycosyltransferase involved in cell wall biosynthesis
VVSVLREGEGSPLIAKAKKISVLMVTGVYLPEINGAVLQCMSIISVLRNNFQFRILTGTKNKKLIKNKSLEGIPIFRTLVYRYKFLNFFQIIGLTFFLVRNRTSFDIIHLHGFSSKSALIIIISKLINKKVIVKLSSFGHDDPETIKSKGKILYFLYLCADYYIGVSPVFKNSYLKLNLDLKKYHSIPNGVNTKIFCPPDNEKEKQIIREKLGLPSELNIILFVGHFSKEKAALDLLNSWLMLEKKSKSAIVFIGSSNSMNFEVDLDVVNQIKSKSSEFINRNIFFVEKTEKIYEYYQASDIYILPSLREGLPNSLLEAMSCGVPVISSKLPDITDWIIEDSIDGFLYSPGNIIDLSLLLKKILDDEGLRKKIGLKARQTIISRFDISFTANKISSLYKKISINES